jgi:hypothetical protein
VQSLQVVLCQHFAGCAVPQLLAATCCRLQDVAAHHLPFVPLSPETLDSLWISENWLYCTDAAENTDCVTGYNSRLQSEDCTLTKSAAAADKPLLKPSNSSTLVLHEVHC